MKTILDVNLYTLQEVANLLGIHQTSVSRYVKEGRLHTNTIGKVKYIPEPELKNFILGTGNKTETPSTQS